MVRFKHRYLLVHLVFPATLDSPLSASAPSASNDPTLPPAQPPAPPLSESALISLLRDSLSVNFGDVGAGEVGGTFSIKYLSPATSTLIVRVSREHHRTLWAALTLLRKVGGQECIARVVHVSGTIRKTQHAAIRHDRAQILLSTSRARGFARARRPREGRSAAAAAKAADEKAKAALDEVDSETERLLKESEARIGAIEA
ncbi:hypothetical protein Rhopal_007279-T1 [Rhodotorula paludigena]|uniref:Uncharacterized protein n=1 Tax=Rhodotorula paludigena TaxID=86838 RepID=A0AAV5GNQ9_9BASI|nr:hypothetical protein Rhopal_007279-T1 [Rhodotorula paludigena]